MSKSELAEYFRNPDLRPTIQERLEDRHRKAQERVAARHEAVAEGLSQRPGKWRFVAIARLPRGSYEDAISGLEFRDGTVIRDMITKEALPVANTTATHLRRRKRLPGFDEDRLPVAEDGGAAAVRAGEEEIQQILDSIPAPSAPGADPASAAPGAMARVREIVELRRSLFPEWPA